MRPRHLSLLLGLTTLVACGDKGDDDEDDTGSVSEDDTGSGTEAVDEDGDGFDETVDCDDTDAAIHPDATEVCDGVDNDCDDLVDDDDDSVDLTDAQTFYDDADEDGFGAPDQAVQACAQPDGTADNGDDCDDANADVNPAATEVCDDADVDEDCSGAADDADSGVDTSTQTLAYADADSDGVGDAADTGTLYCDLPSGTVADNTDCDDTASAINPAATEVCDDADVDEDCSGAADDADSGIDTSTQSDWYADDDLDGYGDSGDATRACDEPSGHVSDDTDCDDSSAYTYPGAPELCDGEDNDCGSSTTDDGQVSFVDAAAAWSDVTSTFSAGTSASPAAVTASSDGTYWFCDGTYYTHIDVTADVTLAGAGTAVVLDGGGADRVVNITTDSLTVSVEDLTLANGTAAALGGNLRCNAASDVTVSRCNIEDATATVGGGIGLQECTADITDTTLSGNYAAASNGHGGGGVMVREGGHATITDSTIDNNEGDYGGGIYVLDASLDLVDTLVSDNVATYGGGAMVYGYASGTTSELVCEGDTSADYGFMNNTATSDGQGVYLVEFQGDYALDTVDCDFGRIPDGTDNDAQAIQVHGGDQLLGVGDDVGLYCDPTGCGTVTDSALGATSSDFTGDDRYRGNIFLATADGSLDDFSFEMDPDSSCVLDYYVASNASMVDSGWTIEWSSTGNTVSGGAGDYGVTDAGVALHAGTYYAVVVGWICSTSGHDVAYYRDTASDNVDLPVGTFEGVVSDPYSTTFSGTGVSFDVFATSTSNHQYAGDATMTTF